MEQDEKCFRIILFRSTQEVIASEKPLKSAGINFKLISVPHNISSNCGFCIRIQCRDEKIAKEVILKSGIHIDKIVSI